MEPEHPHHEVLIFESTEVVAALFVGTEALQFPRTKDIRRRLCRLHIEVMASAERGFLKYAPYQEKSSKESSSSTSQFTPKKFMVFRRIELHPWSFDRQNFPLSKMSGFQIIGETLRRDWVQFIGALSERDHSLFLSAVQTAFPGTVEPPTRLALTPEAEDRIVGAVESMWISQESRRSGLFSHLFSLFSRKIIWDPPVEYRIFITANQRMHMIELKRENMSDIRGSSLSLRDVSVSVLQNSKKQGNNSNIPDRKAQMGRQTTILSFVQTKERKEREVVVFELRCQSLSLSASSSSSSSSERATERERERHREEDVLIRGVGDEESFQQLLHLLRQVCPRCDIDLVPRSSAS